LIDGLRQDGIVKINTFHSGISESNMKYGCVRGWVNGCEAYVISILKWYHAFFFNSPHIYNLLIIISACLQKSLHN